MVILTTPQLSTNNLPPLNDLPQLRVATLVTAQAQAQNMSDALADMCSPPIR